MPTAPYLFLSPGDLMAPGDEDINPWGSWFPISARYYGKPVTAKKAASVRRPCPELLEALKDISSCVSHGVGFRLPDSIMENLNKAIAKAEGKE